MITALSTMQDDEKNLDQQINRLLHAWSDEIDVPPDFQCEVWRRVDQAESGHHALFEKTASRGFAETPGDERNRRLD